MFTKHINFKHLYVLWYTIKPIVYNERHRNKTFYYVPDIRVRIISGVGKLWIEFLKAVILNM